jgi:3-oxoacyl-[acyl-carrier protein] reductase
MESASVALVTGAASGIGQATAERLAQTGCHVVVCDRNGAGADEVAAKILRCGSKAEALCLDITDIAASRAAAESLLVRHGLVEIVVANAGISGDGTAFEIVSQSAFDAMMAVHVKGHFFLLQALVPAMKQAGRGSIVFMSSAFALAGYTSMPHYTAAKGALLALSKALAAELGPSGIRVNAVAPGLIRTSLTARSTGGDESVFVGRAARTPLRRLSTVQEVAETVAFLASPAASSLTGQTISPSSGEVFTD